MTNLYEGKPDGRQGNADTKVSRFRPKYRALSDAEKAHHDAIKTKAAELEALFEAIAPGRYRSLAMTDLELSVMWAVKELTGDGGLTDSHVSATPDFGSDLQTAITDAATDGEVIEYRMRIESALLGQPVTAYFHPADRDGTTYHIRITGDEIVRTE